MLHHQFRCWDSPPNRTFPFGMDDSCCSCEQQECYEVKAPAMGRRADSLGRASQIALQGSICWVRCPLAELASFLPYLASKRASDSLPSVLKYSRDVFKPEGFMSSDTCSLLSLTWYTLEILSAGIGRHMHCNLILPLN